MDSCHIIQNIVKNLKKINNRFYGIILVGMLAGMVGFLLHSFVDTDMYSLQLVGLMCFIIGLIIAVQRIALKEESKRGGI